eukprot:CAMPEP_0114541608 /NCGR_PEP_ID=MMETSP0114-20121206/1394_1 /TAXON_ID=31324 /ORGANISM="Goniomonas sp, Strain m" /LENGTH=157 /DNA_ID=CAMNT_0001725853 /DNA_START=889 /DNA_END=1363 /DNA_ORIENTATION=-
MSGNVEETSCMLPRRAAALAFTFPRRRALRVSPSAVAWGCKVDDAVDGRALEGRIFEVLVVGAAAGVRERGALDGLAAREPAAGLERGRSGATSGGIYVCPRPDACRREPLGSPRLCGGDETSDRSGIVCDWKALGEESSPTDTQLSMDNSLAISRW